MENTPKGALFLMVQNVRKPAVYIKDNLFYINNYTELLTGYKNGDIANLNDWFKLLYPENSNQVKKTYEEALKKGFPLSLEFRLVRKTGDKRFVQFTGYSNDTEVLWLLEDITEILASREDSVTQLRHKTDALKEIKLLKARQVNENIKLKKSNKELEDFAYIASHDLKEPLRKISAFSAQLKEKYANSLDEKGNFYIDRLTNASIRMQKLIDDLLHYSRVSRIELDQMKAIDLPELINYIEFKLERYIQEKKAKIIKKKILPIMGNESLIQSLFQNLITNGIKFHKKSELPVIEIDSEMITIRRRSFVHYTIRDNGIGIESRYLKRVFNIFERLHGIDKYEGTGIGLAISKRVVEKHNGKIAIESEIGVGTTFHLYLPNIQNNLSDD